jgi:hypothetical protein
MEGLAELQAGAVKARPRRGGREPQVSWAVIESSPSKIKSPGQSESALHSASDWSAELVGQCSPYDFVSRSFCETTDRTGLLRSSGRAAASSTGAAAQLLPGGALMGLVPELRVQRARWRRRCGLGSVHGFAGSPTRPPAYATLFGHARPDKLGRRAPFLVRGRAAPRCYRRAKISRISAAPALRCSHGARKAVLGNWDLDVRMSAIGPLLLARSRVDDLHLCLRP